MLQHSTSKASARFLRVGCSPRERGGRDRLGCVGLGCGWSSMRRPCASRKMGHAGGCPSQFTVGPGCMGGDYPCSLGWGELVLLSADSGEELFFAERDWCGGVTRGGVVPIIHRLFPARHPCGSLRFGSFYPRPARALRDCSCLPIAGVEQSGSSALLDRLQPRLTKQGLVDGRGSANSGCLQVITARPFERMLSFSHVI
jgi:hypothetical protein